MKLTYRNLPATTDERPAVVLHDRGAASAERIAGLAQASGAVGQVVVPFGDYGFTASGMELAGICWYRTVPGFAGPDPISLTRAVVQVADLLDEPDLRERVDVALIGWGQGAVVALGTGLLCPDRVTSVVAIDATKAHVDALPARLLAAAGGPRVLAARTVDDPALADDGALGAFGIDATGWLGSGGSDEELDKSMAEEIGRWLEND